MARSSDIEFAKLTLVFNFAKKEQIYAAIRETALLQELGINKRLVHIVFERRILKLPEIHAILWAMFQARKIPQLPPRVVYEFSNNDDRLFLEKVMVPFNLMIEGMRKPSTKTPKVPFPQETLIYCVDIHKKLKHKGFERSLLSILSSKGHLSKAHRKLIPDIDNKKHVLSSPKYVKSRYFRNKCEATLFSTLAHYKDLLKPEEAEDAFKIWEKIIQKHELDFRYSEILYYTGLVKKSDLLTLSVVLKELTGVDQSPRTAYFKLSEEESCDGYIKKEEAKNQAKKYEQLLPELKKMGLKSLGMGNLLLHQKVINPNIVPDVNLLESGENFSVSQNISKQEKESLIKAWIPFSLSSLEQEFINQYNNERSAVRKLPARSFDRIIQEWSQTRLIPLKEIEFSPTEDTSIEGTATIPAAIPKKKPMIKPAKIKGGFPDQTEYFSMEDSASKADTPRLPALFEQTEYMSIEASAGEVKFLSRKISDEIAENRSSTAMLLIILLSMMAIGIANFPLIKLLETATTPPFYMGLGLIVALLPMFLFSKYYGSLADKGGVHQILWWNLLILGATVIALPFFANIYLHFVLRFIQGIAIVGVFVATLFCLSRWYGPNERGKIFGNAMITLTLGYTLGALLVSAPIVKVLNLGKDSFLFCSMLLGAMVLFSLKSTVGMRISPIVSEDMEEEGTSFSLPSRPQQAAFFYASALVAFLAIFFPFTTHIAEDKQSLYILALLMGMGSIFGSFSFGRLGDTVGSIPLLRLIAFGAIGCFFAVPFIIGYTPWNLLLFFAIGTILGALCPLGLTWLLESIDDERYFGQATGSFIAYCGMGVCLGYLLCGGMYYFMASKGLFLTLSIFFSIYLYFLLITSTRENVSAYGVQLGNFLKLLESTSK